jgi:hypothetical protein
VTVNTHDPAATLRSLPLAAKLVFQGLASSIQEAGREAPAAWGLTWHANGRLRLNVGMVEMFVLDAKLDSLVMCCGPRLAAAPQLRRLGVRIEAGHYRNLVDGVQVWIPHRVFTKAYGLIKEEHRAAIERAAAFKGYTWRRSHSGDALREIEAIAGVELPTPLYAKPHRRTFLLTWNPDSEMSEWLGFRRCGETGRWRCWSKAPVTGDRLFWLRQGGAPATRGLFASGWATSPVSADHRIEYRIEHFIHPALPERILPLGRLRGMTPAVVWSTQRSGIAIQPEDAAAAERLWAGFLQGCEEEVALDDTSAAEGEVKYRLALHRARERSLRVAKIRNVLRREGRLVCEVPGCGFDFHRAYGELGRGFAVVHHLVQLASLEEPRTTKLSDLAIVCSNCHAMIHLGQQNRNLQEVMVRRLA